MTLKMIIVWVIGFKTIEFEMGILTLSALLNMFKIPVNGCVFLRSDTMKKVIMIVSLMALMGTVTLAGTTVAEDFEGGWPLSEGWFVTNGASQLSTAQNYTSGGSTSLHVTPGSGAFTTIDGGASEEVSLASGSLAFSFYVDGTNSTAGDGIYDAIEISFRDTKNELASQTWLRKYAIREYKAGGYTSTVPSSANACVVNGWNQVEIDFDYVNGVYDLTVNGVFSWSAPAFGLTDGMSGTGIKSYTWAHVNNNNADIYLDDVNLIPEPATLGLLIGGFVMTRFRKKK